MANNLVVGPNCKNSNTTDDRFLVVYTPIALKEMAAIKIAIAMWYHENVRLLKKDVGYDPDIPECKSKSPEQHADSPELEPGYRDDNFLEYDDYDDNDDYYNDDNDDYDYNDNDYHHGYDFEGCEYCGHGGLHSAAREITRNFKTMAVKVQKLLDCVLLPKSLRDIVSEYIEPIKNEIEAWTTYHHEKVFFHLERHAVYNYVDEIIWGSDGLVDYKATAKQMLTSHRIDDVSKYRFMCIYCFEDEFQKLPPTLFSNKYMDRVSFEKHPLIYYWNCYHRSTLNKITYEGFPSIESRMVTLVDNEYSIQYFLNCLTEEDKLNKVMQLLDRHGDKYQPYLLSQLSEIQLGHVLMEKIANIFVNFAERKSCSKYVCITWIRVRNLITKDQFVEILLKMLNLRFYSDESKGSYMLPILTEIWETASDDLKTFAVDYKNHMIIIKLLKFWHQWDPIKMLNFLSEILSIASADTKMMVIRTGRCREFCQWFMQNTHPILLNNFVKFCLPDSTDAVEFKKQLLNSKFAKEKCTHLFAKEKINEVNEFLSDYISQDEVTEYQTQWLTSDEGKNACLKKIEVNPNLLNNFIELHLPNSKDAVEFKKQLLDSRFVKEKCCCLFDRGNIREMDEFLSNYLSNADVLEYKVKWFTSDEGKRRCLEKLKFGDFESWKSCIHQMLPKNETSENLIKTLLLSSEVMTVFHELIQNGNMKTVQDCIDEFISNENNLKDVKKSLISHYGGEEIISVFNRYGKIRLEEFLLWCLNDEKAVSLYKKSYPFYEVFWSMYFQCVYANVLDFSQLDDFLSWYFVSRQSVIDFKIETIFKFDSTLELNTTFMNERMRDNRRNEVAAWIFEGNDERMRLFKLKYPDLKNSKLI